MAATNAGSALGLVLMLAASPLRSQTVIETAEGRAEVIGLKRWTATMLADSLGLRAPGVSLFQTKECTKALTERLHFSSVYIEKTIVGKPGSAATSVVIRLLEPSDSSLIRWRSVPVESQAPPKLWDALVASLTERGRFKEGRLINPLGLYGYYRARGADSVVQMAFLRGADSVEAIAFWRALESRRTPMDLELALRVIGSDGSQRNRMLAAAVLVNFPASDDAWRSLAEALRDTYPGVNHAAMQSLSMLTRFSRRPVDWEPVAPSLRASLDGTNLETFLPLMQALGQTAIAPSLATVLLKDGGELVVAHANASDARSQQAARTLLRQLHGGTDAHDWKQWIAGM